MFYFLFGFFFFFFFFTHQIQLGRDLKKPVIIQDSGWKGISERILKILKEEEIASGPLPKIAIRLYDCDWSNTLNFAKTWKDYFEFGCYFIITGGIFTHCM